MEHSTKKIGFLPSGRGKARCAADPAYPNGIALPLPAEVTESCFVKLPYPAPECGVWAVTCTLCESSTLITAAGRADDPTSFYMACKRRDENASMDTESMADKTKVN